MDRFISLLPFKRLLFGGGEGRGGGVGLSGKKRAMNVEGGESERWGWEGTGGRGGMVDRMSDQLPFTHSGACHFQRCSVLPAWHFRNCSMCLFSF